MKIFQGLRIVVIIGLLSALLPWSDAYYEALRCVVLAVAVLEMVRIGNSPVTGKVAWMVAFAAVAVVFNPFYVWAFLRWQWSLFDVLAIGLFLLRSFPGKWLRNR